MNPLARGLPATVTVGGKPYRINTSHRVGIRFEVLAALDIDERMKFDAALRLYYPVIPADLWGAIEAMLWFHRMGKPVGESDGVRCYDFTVDFDLIDASFQREYGIDLYAADLHWWKFRALLFGLSEESPFMKAVGYRTMKIPAKTPAEQREFYARMKRLYALPGEKPQRMTVEEIRRAKFADLEH